MAKKRKTRQEKIIADLRRKLVTQTPTTTPAAQSVVSTYSLPQTKPVIQSAPNYLPAGRQGQLRITNLARQGASSTYSFVLSDLRKTAILTIVATAAQIVLYFILMR